MGDDILERPDYSYWLMVRIWSPYEASNLLLGITPWTLPLLWDECGDKQSEAKIEQEKLLRILNSAAEAGEFGKTWIDVESQVRFPSISSFDWVTWSKRNNIDCDKELLDAIDDLNTQTGNDAEDLHPRFENTLLRIVGALLQELKMDSRDSQAGIIEQIVDLHGHKDGISRSTLENVFSNANRRLKDW